MQKSSQFHPAKIARVLAVSSTVVTLLVVSGCRGRGESDNPDVAAEYRDSNPYEDDIVTAAKRRDYDDQGASIAPKTLLNIEDTITSVYEKDFERCLESEMDTVGTRFMRSAFVVEFTIDTSGKASKAKVLEIMTRKQDPKGSDLGEVDSGGMKSCIQSSISDWEFDPPPEVDYVHTYRGRVGEAF
jgi:hypothetical protein